MEFSLSAMARSLPFAHLAGVGARARAADSAKRAEDDESDPPAERDREDGAHAGASADDSGDDSERRDDDQDTDADSDRAPVDDDAPNIDSKRSGKAKRARAEDDDSGDDADSDEELHGGSEAASARRREQARCAAIFASHAAASNPVLAANLAFRTRLSRSAALAILESTPAATAHASVERSAHNPRVGPGGTPEANSRQAIAASWDRAFAAVNQRSR